MIKKTQNKIQRICQKHFDSRLKAISRRKNLRTIAVSIIVILTFLGSLSNRNVNVYTETSSFANQMTEETNSPPASEIQSTESTDQSSNNETTSTTTSTQLIDPTEEEIAAAKAAGKKLIQKQVKVRHLVLLRPLRISTDIPYQMDIQ